MNQDIRTELDNMKKEVEETRGAIASAKAVLTSMSNRIKAVADSEADAASMKAELNDYAQQLNAMQDDLAQAIVANDPDRPAGGSGVGSAGGAGLHE